MLECDSLVRHFSDRKRGTIRAVDGISLSCHQSEILGVLGPNGAGKTTLLRMLSTLITPTSGTASVAGFDIRFHASQVRARIGFLSASMALYERLTARENVEYFGALHGLHGNALRRRCSSLFDQLEIEEFADRRCDRLSTGQKQRVAIARCIVHEPPVMFFDEPTTGLDVLAARSIKEFIRGCKSQGRAVIFSTHIMSEVELLCDRIAVIYEGRLAALGTLAELRAATGCTAFEEVFLNLIGASGAQDRPPASVLGGAARREEND
ncbi:MAG: ATP-binding cassette domain-containing protein [Armatimonadetes bacterium]|nr:ATP-binding cassette domain-containing protein [Armatimonadota bacterium]MDE2205410.1 ATP-binding cassette domain-containing protein [Armatimonadota bacterium]